jgi:hypothetical protein
MCLLGTLDVAEFDICKAFGPTRLAICGHPDAFDIPVIAKCLPQLVLSKVETEIANKQHGRRRTLRVTKRLRPLLARGVRVTWKALVNIDSATFDLFPVHKEGSLDSFCSRKMNISKSTGSTRVTIDLNRSRDNLSALSELLC